MPSPSFALREAVVADVPAIHAMALALAESEGTRASFAATEEDWRRDGFGTAPRFRAIVADTACGIIGMVTYGEFYSTGVGQPALFVIDLYVAPDCRRSGIGSALLARVAGEAITRHASAVLIAARATNRAAKLYRRLGFRVADGMQILALAGIGLAGLAQWLSDLAAPIVG